jgi:hypothetical protein
MAEPIQLDAAAALVGKSEVTLRRLIKAGKIPVQKEKTLTGFMYLVNPDDVTAYYAGKGGDASFDDMMDMPEPITPRQSQSVPLNTPARRLAVAGESGNPTEYWQKRAESYEDRYHGEMQKHSQTREELGVWRGRAEHAQAMLMKMLPSPTEVTTSDSRKEEAPIVVQSETSWLITFLSIIVTVACIVLIAGVSYYVYRHR